MLTTNVAKWSFNSNNTRQVINLSDQKIFPGSNGKFEIEINATGAETNIEYKIVSVEEKNIPQNFEFYAEIINEIGEILETTDKYNLFSKLAEERLCGNIGMEKNNQIRKVIVYWNWKNEDNLLDMKDGTLLYNTNNESSLNCSLIIEIIGKQI